MNIQNKLAKVVASGVAGALSRGISMISPIVTIPLTLSHFGEVTFGLWMTISSLAGFLVFADLGLGNSILSEVSRAVGKGNQEKVRIIISTTYIALCAIAVISAPILIGIAATVDWGAQFSLTDPREAIEARRAMIVAAALFCANIPASLIYKIQMAGQQAVQANLWQAAGSFAGMVLILIALKFEMSLSAVIAGFLGGPVLIWAIATWHFFKRSHQDFCPSFMSANFATLRSLLQQSLLFFVLGILLSFTTSIDTFIVSKTLGLESAGRFSIGLRVSAVLSLIPLMMYMPLWAANGEAIGRGDFGWVRNAVRKMTLICPFITACIGVPILLSSDNIFRIWLHSETKISTVLLGGLFAWALLQGLSAPRFMVLNSVGLIRSQIAMQCIFVAISIPAKIYCLKAFGLGSLPWVNASAYCLIVLPALEYVYRSSLLTEPPIVARECLQS